MDSKFMSYFTADKASDKQSTFDLSHHNLLSAMFGGLTVTYWDKVYAKDYYKIAASTQSKGAALSSPTFTELKSNDYAFFCPNQILWKHWNDYFTNGTEFAETYGSNKNNQEISGIFKEPYIPVNYLQLIGKIAKGYACPYHSFSLSDVYDYLSADVTFNVPEVYLRSQSSISVIGGNDYVSVSPIDIINMIVMFNADLAVHLKGVTIGSGSVWMRVDSNHKIDFTQKFFFNDGTQSKVINGFTYTAGDNMYFLASPRDANVFYKNFLGSTYQYSNSTITNNRELTFTNKTFVQSWYLFFDSVSTRPQFSDSPFVINYENSTSHIFDTDVMLSDITYAKRLGYSDNRTFDRINFHRSDAVSFVAQVGHSSFHLRRSQSFYYKFWLVADYVGTPHTFFGSSYRFYVKKDLSDYFESEYYQCYLRQNGASEPLAANLSFDPFVSTNASSESPFDEINPQYYYDNSTQKKYYFPSYDFRSSVNLSKPPISHQGNILTLPVFNMFHYVYHPSLYNCPTDPLIYDPSANCLGYTQFGFFIYLCQNSCRHLDYVGLPLQSFIPRQFKEYSQETISALPFFAYSKIWNEYFRNRTVSSPELDYSETNGNIFQSRNYVAYYNKYPKPPEEPLESFNSWVIPFSCTPKSGIAKDQLHLFGNGVFQNFENELHYYNLNNMSSVLSLLTGYQLNMHILNQLAAPYIVDSGSNSTYVLGFIYDHFVLPNYYNGLLHYKYQNFTKDYFSSALLDPMSGANQENIPQTVTELRTAQAKQSFWERTAVARSIKKFYEMMVGTTPTHIEYDKPLLLGSDHQNVNVSEVIQTSETDKMPLGSRAGIIADFGKGGLCSHFFNEPGVIMVLHSITVDAQYMQGLQKKFTPYESYLDYPFTQFAHIGNESIQMRELNYSHNSYYTPNLSTTAIYSMLGIQDDYGLVGIPRSSTINNPHYVYERPFGVHRTSANMVDATSDDLNAVFGYIPRYSYLKFAFDEVHGDFRDSMDYWHTFREFHYMPYLSHEFVNYESALRDSNLSRIFAVLEEGDKFWQSIHFYITVKRSVPYYTVPRNSVN